MQHFRKILIVPLATGTLLSFICHVSPAIALGGGSNADQPWNPHHITQLPPEIRNAVSRLCGPSLQAEHYFVTYSDNSRLINLHFERARCPSQKVCTQAGCLHQVYVLTKERYRLLKSYYGPSND